MELKDIIEFAKCFTNESRLKLIKFLAERELCVCELEEVTGQSQSNISQHLRNLYNAGLVKKRRDGQLIYYSLDTELFQEKIEAMVGLVNLPLEEIDGFEDEKDNFRNLDDNQRIKECKNCQGR